MNKILLLLVTFLFPVLSIGNVNETYFANTYERYNLNVQVNKTINKGKLFVLVFIGKPGNEIHDEGQVYPKGLSLKDGDGAYFPFLVSIGDEKTETATHAFHKDKLYSTTIKLTKRYDDLVVLEYGANVKRNGEVVFVTTGSVFTTVTDF